LSLVCVLQVNINTHKSENVLQRSEKILKILIYIKFVDILYRWLL